MSDLELPQAWWPGVDTYGPGKLSLDGRTWAAHTDAGVVFVNLQTGAVRHVALPGTRSRVRYVAWVPGDDVVSVYATGTRGRRYLTFHVGPQGEVQRMRYDGSRTRFDIDGTPVKITRSARRELVVTRWEDDGPRSVRWELPADFTRMWDWGEFGERDVALSEYTRKESLGPTLVWVFDKSTGEARARLRVPPTSSVEGWLDARTLIVLADNRHLIAWEPGSRSVRRLMELPGPYPEPGEWAAATVSLALGS